ncbi:MAG: PucR family transcriptional regulator ligand-binding domain-containing protein, partial [Actinomycetota bacterium]
MALTIGELLELDIFRRAEAEVVAGARYLDRPVRWVHVTELPDIAYLLKGGELLLTSGIGLDGGPEVQRRCVRELAEVGAAGLVVELVRVFREELPSALIEEAERCAFPLVTLRRETRFVDITEQVHSAIISRQLQLLKKAESIGRSFTELVLRGAGLRRILHRLAGIVQNPVVLEDAAHQAVELVAHGRPAEVVFSRWERHSRAGHEEHGRGFVTMERGELNCAWASIWLREERWGRVHVLEFDRSVDEMDRLALDRAVAALGMSLLVERNTEYLADHARTALISDILQERYESTQEILHRASSLGVNLAPECRLAALVVEPLGLSEVAMERRLPEKGRQALRASILTDVRRAMQRDGRSG